MRIESVRIENFRSFEDAIVPFNKSACLVGPNGAGKSTVLTALNVFFRETENLPTDLIDRRQTTADMTASSEAHGKGHDAMT